VNSSDAPSAILERPQGQDCEVVLMITVNAELLNSKDGRVLDLMLLRIGVVNMQFNHRVVHLRAL
jgi:hypothetical protein